MNREILLKLAKRYLILDDGSSEANLVRKIQVAEGHLDCFATGKKSCDEGNCKWRQECLGDSPAVSTGLASKITEPERS